MALSVTFAGLWTNPNPSSSIPDGAALRANNLVSTRPGLAECRPGQNPDPAPYGDASDRLRSGIAYNGYGFEHTGASLYRRDVSAGTVTKIASVQAPGGLTQRLRFAVAGDDLYMATDKGIRSLDGPMATPKRPGVTRAEDPFITDYNNGGSGPYPGYEYSGAYRVAFFTYDAEGRPVYGEPSGRIVFSPTNHLGGARVFVAIPPGIEAGMGVHVFRTPTVAGTAGPPPVTIDPGDIMYVAAEKVLTASNINAKSVELIDLQPNELLGAPLYTNATVAFGGILSANLRPPFGTDVALYKQSLFVANVKHEQSVNIRLIGLPSSGDTITIAGLTYTAGSQNNTSGTFGIVDTGTVSSNITRTAQMLATAINARTDNTRVSAYYVSGPNDPPGILQIVDRDVGGSIFHITGTGNTSVYEPPISTPVASSDDAAPNGIDVSKPGLPYAFTRNTASRLRLGAANAKVLRLIPNRDSLFVFKEDGIWVVFEAGNGWGSRQISTDIVLMFPDSVAVLDNQVHAFTNRGLVVVDETGIEEFDLPIKDKTKAILNTFLSGSGAGAPAAIFGVADPTALRYTLWYSNGSTGQRATDALVYNLSGGGVWTERDDDTTGGYMGVGGLLYLGLPDAPGVSVERRTGTSYDYQDADGQPIQVDLEWRRIVDPSGDSQFTELRLITEQPTTGPYTFTFTNHYNASLSATFQGEGLPVVRAWVPNGVQRTSRLRARVQRNVLAEYLVIMGLSDASDDYGGPPTKA